MSSLNKKNCPRFITLHIVASSRIVSLHQLVVISKFYFQINSLDVKQNFLRRAKQAEYENRRAKQAEYENVKGNSLSPGR